MFSIQMRMVLVLAVFFGIMYALVTVGAVAMGQHNFYFHVGLALAMMAIQYMVGPKMVEWSMRVQYVTRDDAPELYRMVEDMAQRANIPMPRVCISRVNVPNAFAFGRGQRDGRVCVTEGIVRLLNKEELRAVIGHEVGHLRNRDVLTITLLSVVPMILYRVAWSLMFRGRRNNGSGPAPIVVGMIAFLMYFLSNLLVMYTSRIREYFADKAAVEFGNRPEALASALYKLVYGSARMNKEELKDVEGMKAFFCNDISNAGHEIKDLAQIDTNRSGTIDAGELARIRNMQLKLSSADQMMELMMTHPNMLKRIQHLAQLS